MDERGMTLYHLLKTGRYSLDDLIANGVASVTVKRDLELMDHYNARADIAPTNAELVAECSRKFRISVTAVYSIVRRYSASIKVIAVKR